MPVADCANPANGFLDAARTLCITVQTFPQVHQRTRSACRLDDLSAGCKVRRIGWLPSGPALRLSDDIDRRRAGSAQSTDKLTFQETKWADPPAQSLTGDATLVLDAQEGPPLSVHSLYLQHASSLFRDMILLRQSSTVAVTSCVDWLESSQDSDSPVAKRQRAELKLSLPGTSRKQTLLLLHCMYAWDGTAAVEDMHLPELVDLANVLDKYGAVLMLRRVDGLLLAACAAEQKLIPGCSDIPEAQAAAWLNVQDAPALFVWAGKLHLSKTQAHLAEYMVQHAPMIDVSKLDATSAAFLRGAQALHTRP